LGLAEAHAKGIIHRDLKPQNVLIDEVSGQVLITDFGLARIASESQITTAGATLGTQPYMAPELDFGRPDVVGPLSDMYSLGVILYQLLTGQVPFAGSYLEVLGQKMFTDPLAPWEVRPGSDKWLSKLCLTAMAREPDRRFTSVRALADE